MEWFKWLSILIVAAAFGVQIYCVLSNARNRAGEVNDWVDGKPCGYRRD